jgi:hypothetical protein
MEMREVLPLQAPDISELKINYLLTKIFKIMAIDLKKIDWEKEGSDVKADSRQSLRRDGKKPSDFYGTHSFKEGQTSTLRSANGFQFPVIGEISAERLLSLGVADIVFNDNKTKYLYYITRDCKVKVTHGGVKEYLRDGKVEPRNVTEYELV